MFPGRRAEIEDLVRRNDEFADMCRDYEELAAWLEAAQASGRDSELLQPSVELLENLTREIEDFAGEG